MCLLTTIMHMCSQLGLTACGMTGDSPPLAGDGVGAHGIVLGTPLGTAHGTALGTLAGTVHGTLAGMAAGTEVGIAHIMAIMAGEATTIVHRTTPSVVSQAHEAVTPAQPVEVSLVATT